MQQPPIVLSNVCGIFMVVMRCITYVALYNIVFSVKKALIHFAWF